VASFLSAIIPQYRPGLKAVELAWAKFVKTCEETDIMFWGIIHRLVSKNCPVYFSKRNVSETELCPRLHVIPTQLGPIDRASQSRSVDYAAATQNGHSNHSVYRQVRGHYFCRSGAVMSTALDTLPTKRWCRTCGLRDHRISHLPTYTSGANWREPFVPNGVPRGMSCAVSLKQLGGQRTTCLKTFRGLGILDAILFSY
jgi:hypothetical protein